MTRRLLSACALSLLCAACPLPGAYCPYEACEPHGHCEDIDGEAVCVCDECYEPGPDLSCIPVPDLQTGDPCFEDANCESGICYKIALELSGYCTIYDCTSRDDCFDHAPVEGLEMCCIHLEDKPSFCARVREGGCNSSE